MANESQESFSRPLPSDQEIHLLFRKVFSTTLDADIPAELSEIAAAFQDLTGLYVEGVCPTLLPAVRFDVWSLGAMIKRFHRDAFGMLRFTRFADGLLKASRIDLETHDEILDQVRRLGVRISTSAPRKTRIAAAFSLWMSTFRPVYFGHPVPSGVPVNFRVSFCASLNFWMATGFLKQFGEINLGSPGEDQMRLRRIKYDFTYRDLNLSSLEMLYSSIFRLRAKS